MILVTGATGLIGSQVCKLLKEQSLPFIALKRTNSRTALCADIDINWVDGDILDIVTLEELMQGVDTVIHCAGMVSFDKKEVEEMMNINVIGTQNIVNCCLGSGVSNLIHVSSVAALGRGNGGEIVTEKTQWVDCSLSTNYAKSKYLSEVEIWRGKSEGLNICSVNPSIVLAAGDGQRSSSKLLQYVWEEHNFYVNKQLHFVDVRDVASAILKIYKENAWGKRYILSQGGITYKTLFQELAKRLGKKMPRWNIAIKYLRIVAFLSKIFSFMFNKPTLISNELIKSMKGELSYSSDKIREDLQFEFMDLNDTFDWVTTEFVKSKSSK